MRRATAIDAELGARLRTFRKSLRVNQTKLGAAVGLTFQQIQKYENGENRISAATLFELAHVVGVDISQFFEGLKPNSRKLKAEGPKARGRPIVSAAPPEHTARMAPLKSEPPGMERDSKGKAIPLKERTAEDRAKAKRGKAK